MRTSRSLWRPWWSLWQLWTQLGGASHSSRATLGWPGVARTMPPRSIVSEQWKKWGRSLKTRGVGGVEAYAPAISVHHLHSPPEPQQWGSCSLGAEELHQGVQVSPPGRSTLGSGHCWRTQRLGTPCNLVTLWVRALHRARWISCISPPLLWNNSSVPSCDSR